MVFRIYYCIKSLEGPKFDVKPEKLFETLSNTNITLLFVFYVIIVLLPNVISNVKFLNLLWIRLSKLIKFIPGI